MPAISRSMCLAHRSKPSPTNSRPRRKTNFAGIEWTPGLGNAPVLADSVANFQCLRRCDRIMAATTFIFLGAVEAYAYNRQEPLLFHRGGYGRFVT